jgi:hypothetical protein
MASLFAWFCFSLATVPLATTFVPAALALFAPAPIMIQFAKQKPLVRAIAASTATVVVYPVVSLLNWFFSALFSPIAFVALTLVALVVNVKTRSLVQHWLYTNTGINVAPLIDWTDYVATFYDVRVSQIKDATTSKSTSESRVVVDDHDEVIVRAPLESESESLKKSE